MSGPFDKQLVLVTGKGGVGRSTVAASIAAACARRGRKTLLYEFNANDRYGDFFGLGRSVGSEVVRLRPNLHAINTSPAAALEEYGMMVLRFRRVYRMVFENRVTKYFLRAIPGLDDYSILGKAWHHTEKKRGSSWDTVVFDMAASGHSLSMLRIPSVILETVPEGPLTRDARSIQNLLTDRSRTAVVMTTLAEDMPVNEAQELKQGLQELGIEVHQLVVNQVFPEFVPPGSPTEKALEALDGADGLSEALVNAREHAVLARERRKLNERYLGVLGGSFSAPRAQLPLLFRDRLGPEDIDALSQLLEEQLA